MKIGFIGLGAMGKGMAASLLRAGHQVTAWNRSPGPVQELKALGAEIVDSARAAFGGHVFISMLSDDAALREVVIEKGLLPKGGASTIHVNMATISVTFAQELAAFHRAAGVPYISAPVFGRLDVAAAGKLNILAAGDPAAIEKARPALESMGQRIWMLGADPRQANAVKICGNFMVGAAIEAMSEAMALGKANGVEADRLIEILTTVLFDAPVYRVYGKIIAERRFEPAGFKLPLGLKDIELALEAGSAGNVPLPYASILREHLLDAIAHDGPDKDWAIVADVALRRAKLDKPR